MDIIHSYNENGSGEVLVLLHGNGESKEYFEYQMAELSKIRRVIALDTRGHGATPRGEKPFTLSSFADDLHDFLDLKKITCADILGFSDGANIALHFALKYPNRVNKLILNGGNLTPFGVKARFQIPIVIEYALFALASSFDKRAKQKAELLSLMVKEPCFKEEELSKIALPTLIIAGTHDMIKESETRRIHKYIENSELRFVVGSHFAAFENPDEFNSVVWEFLTK